MRRWGMIAGVCALVVAAIVSIGTSAERFVLPATFAAAIASLAWLSHRGRYPFSARLLVADGLTFYALLVANVYLGALWGGREPMVKPWPLVAALALILYIWMAGLRLVETGPLTRMSNRLWDLFRLKRPK